MPTPLATVSQLSDDDCAELVATHAAELSYLNEFYFTNNSYSLVNHFLNNGMSPETLKRCINWVAGVTLQDEKLHNMLYLIRELGEDYFNENRSSVWFEIHSSMRMYLGHEHVSEGNQIATVEGLKIAAAIFWFISEWEGSYIEMSHVEGYESGTLCKSLSDLLRKYPEKKQEMFDFIKERGFTDTESDTTMVEAFLSSDHSVSSVQSGWL